MSDDAKAAAMAEIQKYLAEHFDPLWEKVGPHAMLGGAVRTFWNAETQSVDMECISPEDMYREAGE